MLARAVRILVLVMLSEVSWLCGTLLVYVYIHWFSSMVFGLPAFYPSMISFNNSPKRSSRR